MTWIKLTWYRNASSDRKKSYFVVAVYQSTDIEQWATPTALFCTSLELFTWCMFPKRNINSYLQLPLGFFSLYISLCNPIPIVALSLFVWGGANLFEIFLYYFLCPSASPTFTFRACAPYAHQPLRAYKGRPSDPWPPTCPSNPWTSILYLVSRILHVGLCDSSTEWPRLFKILWSNIEVVGGNRS